MNFDDFIVKISTTEQVRYNIGFCEYILCSVYDTIKTVIRIGLSVIVRMRAYYAFSRCYQDKCIDQKDEDLIENSKCK